MLQETLVDEKDDELRNALDEHVDVQILVVGGDVEGIRERVLVFSCPELEPTIARLLERYQLCAVEKHSSENGMKPRIKPRAV